MEENTENLALIDRSRKYIKDNKSALILKFANPEFYPASPKTPETFLMAGSPGAGKTEFSLAFANSFESKSGIKMVVIDPDELKKAIPWYDGHRAELFQSASSLGVDKIYDSVIKHRQSVIIDGTLAHLEIAKKNIDRSLRHGRSVSIFYVFQDPLLAWAFSKDRERKDGRFVSKETFITCFWGAKNNVNILKKEYGKNINLDIIIKNIDNKGVEKTHFNVTSVDSYIKNRYSDSLTQDQLC